MIRISLEVWLTCLLNTFEYYHLFCIWRVSRRQIFSKQIRSPLGRLLRDDPVVPQAILRADGLAGNPACELGGVGRLEKLHLLHLALLHGAEPEDLHLQPLDAALVAPVGQDLRVEPAGIVHDFTRPSDNTWGICNNNNL